MEEYLHAGRPVGSLESVVMSGKFQMASKRQKCFAKFLHCIEVSHNLDGLDLMYRGVRIYCNH